MGAGGRGPTRPWSGGAAAGSRMREASAGAPRGRREAAGNGDGSRGVRTTASPGGRSACIQASRDRPRRTRTPPDDMTIITNLRSSPSAGFRRPRPGNPSSDSTPVGDELPEYTVWNQWRGTARNGVVGGPEWPAARGRCPALWAIEDLGDNYATPWSPRTASSPCPRSTSGRSARADRKTGRRSGDALETLGGALRGQERRIRRRPPSMARPSTWVACATSWSASTPATDRSAGAWFVDEFDTNPPSRCAALVVDDALYIQARRSMRLDKETGGRSGAPPGANARTAPSLAHPDHAGEQLVIKSLCTSGMDPDTARNLDRAGEKPSGT